MCRTVTLAATLMLCCPAIACADGRYARSDSWWTAWHFDPLILCSLSLLAWLYCRGLRRLWTRPGQREIVCWWQAGCFLGALALILIALLSPLDAISAELSSVHMVQHMLLMMVAAPLFVLGSPHIVLALAALPDAAGSMRSVLTFLFRLAQESLLWQPLLIWTLFNATLWCWHHPLLYQAALHDPLLHDAQHLSFFVSAFLFWRLCVDPLGARRLSAPAAVPYLFTAAASSAALGVFLALSPSAWYGVYAPRTAAWGFSPLEDQQLAGLLMWMPACLVFPVASAVLFGIWLAQLPRFMQNRKRRLRIGPAIAG